MGGGVHWHERQGCSLRHFWLRSRLCHPCTHPLALVRNRPAPGHSWTRVTTPHIRSEARARCAASSAALRPGQESCHCPRQPIKSMHKELWLVVRPGHLSLRGGAGCPGKQAMVGNHTTQWSAPSRGSSRGLRHQEGNTAMSRWMGGQAGPAEGQSPQSRPGPGLCSPAPWDWWTQLGRGATKWPQQ